MATNSVLILVLMEDTLRASSASEKSYSSSVLILVLMEDTLRDLTIAELMGGQSLNPCFNGRYSQREV